MKEYTEFTSALFNLKYYTFQRYMPKCNLTYSRRRYVFFIALFSHKEQRALYEYFLERISLKLDNKCGNYQGWKLSRIEFHVYL
jgi:hypothetical protein